MVGRYALYALTLLSAYQIGKDYGPQVDQYLQGQAQPPPMVYQMPVEPIPPQRKRSQQASRAVQREQIIERQVPVYISDSPVPQSAHITRVCRLANGQLVVFYDY